MNEVSGNILAKLHGPGEPPEDGEMNEMTLPSRQELEITALAV